MGWEIGVGCDKLSPPLPLFIMALIRVKCEWGSVKGKVSHKKGEARMSPRYPTISIITRHMVPLLHIF